MLCVQFKGFKNLIVSCSDVKDRLINTISFYFLCYNTCSSWVFSRHKLYTVSLLTLDTSTGGHVYFLFLSFSHLCTATCRPGRRGPHVPNIVCRQHLTGARAASPEPPRGPGLGGWRLRERGRRGANGTNEGQGEMAGAGKRVGKGAVCGGFGNGN